MNYIPRKLISDVDGVITDGSYYYSVDGKVLKKFGPHDKDGLKILKPLIKIIFITADKNGFKISQKRIKDWGFCLYLVTEEDRENFICKQNNSKQIIFIADGYHDAKLFKKINCSITPSSARIEAKKNATFITPSKGGEGVLLDAAIYIKKKFFKC